MADFVFATCQPGREPALKREVARTRPELRFAYSRPGLVTFRAPGDVVPDDPVGSAFARVWGKSLGKADGVEAAAALLAPYAIARAHVFLREPVELVEAPAAATPAPRDSPSKPAPISVGTTRDQAGPTIAAGPEVGESRGSDTARVEPVAVEPWQALGASGSARVGDLVADIVLAAGEPAWIGVHQHDATRSPHPGGGFPVELPSEAPSRAYSKLEEAIAWAHLPVKRGDVALEIGAAPGGAVYALQRRGLEVYAVDPGHLAPHVAKLPRVHHLAIKVGALRWEQLPARVDWLLCDVNLAPQVALHELARLMPRLKSTLKGAIITLKLNELRFVDELPALLDRISAMGLPNATLRHLPSNRSEVCCVALPASASGT